MSFAPVVPMGGYAGWAFLTRTLDAQKSAFLKDSAIQRDEAYFREKIGSVRTAEELVSDRRLLNVALTAFGLEDDINNKAFLRKILEDGTLKPDGLGNRLADKRYLEFSKAFGFGDFPVPNTVLSDFPQKILARYEARRFEAAVGEQNEDMRLALNARRELADIAKRSMSVDAKWYTALGSPPLRQVIQTALGLPRSFSQVDIDKQLVILKDRAESALGTTDLKDMADPAQAEKLVRLFLVRSQMQSDLSGANDGSTALTLLQQSQAARSRLSLYL
ncbi:DUF1217 domain-containing protein [Frigidibacter sp. RF13]|uniref:DUF1217 domain-containing protein n=1 Tax=Frigidibacter sp. RF13 TaxID=2997340 RepID=UPI002271CEBE|nr:DUF1217 domain-containing protein [Frigidibacter sp. RF13]MCY1128706.1 DUF1217 domain-containing protein [Frigidibacter sp. RF13]